MFRQPSISTAVMRVGFLVSLLHGAALSALPQSNPLTAFDGEWVFVEDLTEGRALEQLNPPMSSKFVFRTEPKAIILVSGHGSGHKDVRIAFDGKPTEVPGSTAGALARYRASWKGGVLAYEVEFVRKAGGEPEGQIKREFRMTPDGLVVHSNLMLTPGIWSVGLYRHAKDIPMPMPAKAKIGDLSWLAGAWVGSRGATGAISIEERWSPPKGGSMLGVSRTVSRDRLAAFEYLRIIEREGGLFYVAQPNGGAPTEFTLTEVSGNRAVFDNPRHDYPKRIVYELTADGVLTATIGQLKGGTPMRLEFRKEGT